MSDSSKMEIVPVTTGYPLLREQSSVNEVLALIRENLGGANFSVLNLPRIRVPSGGSLAFRIDGAGGEESAKQIEGIIVAWRSARVYWKKAYGSGKGKKPPDCTSIDGFIGKGDPGGECQACPYSRFGTALNPDGSQGQGQACKEIRQALFLMQDEILPHLISIPPTSIKAFSQYTLTLLSSRSAYWGATTVMSLDRATNEGGIEYAKLSFRLGQRLPPEALQLFAPYHQEMKELLTPTVIDASAYEIVDDLPPVQPGRRESGPQPTDDDVPF